MNQFDNYSNVIGGEDDTKTTKLAKFKLIVLTVTVGLVFLSLITIIIGYVNDSNKVKTYMFAIDGIIALVLMITLAGLTAWSWIDYRKSIKA